MVMRIDSSVSYVMGDRGRTRLLVALCDPERDRLWLREAGRQARLGMAGLYDEIVTLERLGLIKRRRAGGAQFLVADTDHPLHAGVNALVESAARLDEAIAQGGHAWPYLPLRGRSPFPNPDKRGPEDFDPFAWTGGESREAARGSVDNATTSGR